MEILHGHARHGHWMAFSGRRNPQRRNPRRLLPLALGVLISGASLGGPLPALARPGLGGGLGFGGLGSGVGGYRFGGGVGDFGRWRPDVHPVFGPAARPIGGWDARGADFYARPFNGWHTAWAGGGFWGARPWSAGWYRVNPLGWGWWGASAAAWGVAGLASASTITALVNEAATQQSTQILVPQSPYRLNYASVEPVGSAGASFSYGFADESNLFGGVNCQEGLLNGQPPASADQAQLVNAVCQVAYGTPS